MLPGQVEHTNGGGGHLATARFGAKVPVIGAADGEILDLYLLILVIGGEEQLYIERIWRKDGSGIWTGQERRIGIYQDRKIDTWTDGEI
jgi:hypothetical protein